MINISASFGSQNAISNFEYDGDGNRISKSITDNNGTRLSTYVWDVNSGLPQVLTKSDANGTTIYDYGIDLISITDPVKGQFYYHYDGLGSVRSLSDNSGGIKATYSYDAFGQPSLMSGSIDNDFLFTGEQTDKETGLIYLRARYYDPSIGRFLTRDPILFAGGNTNLYEYVRNDPTNLVDPSGLWGIGPTVSGSAEAGAGVVAAAATGSLGGGIFGGGQQGLNLGGFGSAGGFLGGPGHYYGYPSGNIGVAEGAFAGIGVGLFGTNANSVSELKGPFYTISLNIGIGPVKGSIQYAFSGGTGIVSITVGPGAFFSSSAYKTNTWTTK